MQKTTVSPAMPGPIGQRLLIQAATARRRSRATYAGAVGAAGLERSNMSHTRNTKKKIYPHHEAWAVENGYREEAASRKQQAASRKRQAPSIKPQALTIQKSQAN